jgi:hypothetical protein
MNVRIDETGFHAPVKFIKMWSIDETHRTALLTSGEVKEEIVHIPLERYLEIKKQFYPEPPARPGSEHAAVPITLFHPGSLLVFLIYKITGEKIVGCSACSRRGKQMDVWGWWGCWRNREIILGWLVEEARKLGHTVERKTAFSLLKIAIREALRVRVSKPSGSQD